MPSTPCDCSLIVPTYNRSAVLGDTLSRIECLPDRRASHEVIVIDNGSTDDTAALQTAYPRTRFIQLGRNLGAAARNVGAVAARGRLLLMLDDDSRPEPGTLDRLVALFDRRRDLGAAACRVRLAEAPHRHDAGGVPGIFFNCGGVIRRKAFLQAGGFPIDFDYYVEEYDLCCRLWQRGWRIEPRGDLLVWHSRVSANRDNNRMLRLLVRNNLRLWARYAPASELDDCIASTIERYRRVAEKENAAAGFEAGLREGQAELASRSFRRHPLSHAQYESLLGLGAARQTLRHWADNHCVQAVAVWGRGKGCEQLLGVLASLRIDVSAVHDGAVTAQSWRGLPLRHENDFNPREAQGVVVGSLSPGVAADLAADLERRFPGMPVVSAAPWVEHEPARVAMSA
jgi:GT2 family glycosyltransferase